MRVEISSSIDERIKNKVRRRLIQFEQPVKRNQMPGIFSNDGWSADDVWRVLESMVKAGELWHKNGLFYLLDRRPDPAWRANCLPDSSEFGFNLPEEIELSSTLIGGDS